MREIAECAVMPGRLAIDPAALIIEEDDVAHESRLKVAIGSTGTGGGAALNTTYLGRAGSHDAVTWDLGWFGNGRDSW